MGRRDCEPHQRADLARPGRPFARAAGRNRYRPGDRIARRNGNPGIDDGAQVTKDNETSLKTLKFYFKSDTLRRFPRGLTMNLSEPQTIAIIHAAKPLQPAERAGMLAALEILLADRKEVGDGELFRALRELQHKYYRPPPVGTWT